MTWPLRQRSWSDKARRKLARFFGAPDPNRVIFANNATDALNMAIQGMLRPGDHVVSTRMEHNSVLRPLYHLRRKGLIEYDLVPFDGQGFVDPEEIARAIRPNTRLVISPCLQRPGDHPAGSGNRPPLCGTGRTISHRCRPERRCHPYRHGGLAESPGWPSRVTSPCSVRRASEAWFSIRDLE